MTNRFCETYPFLKTLCDFPGVSGDEKNLALLIADYMTPYADQVSLDKTGNLIAFKKGQKTPEKPVLFCAHLDEVGFMVRHIMEDGTLLFEQVGMLNETLPGKRVTVGNNALPGVICCKPVHLTQGEKRPPSPEELYIDIGAANRKAAEELGVYAAYAAFENDFTCFGNGLVRSKALDDRFGCLILTELIKCIPVYDTYFVFTVGEELGGVGATAAVNRLQAGVAVVFESTTASDIPDNAGAAKVCTVGGGAVLPFMDGGTLYDRELYRKISAFAKENGVNIQTKSRVAGGTDAASIQRALSGVKVLAVSLPCRYIHTASCVASEADMAECLKLGRLLAETGVLI